MRRLGIFFYQKGYDVTWFKDNEKHCPLFHCADQAGAHDDDWFIGRAHADLTTVRCREHALGFEDAFWVSLATSFLDLGSIVGGPGCWGWS